MAQHPYVYFSMGKYAWSFEQSCTKVTILLGEGEKISGMIRCSGPAHQLHHPLELGLPGGLYRYLLSAYRMNEAKHLSVEQHGRHLPALFKQPVLLIAAVRPVANNGVQDVTEVLADLVHTPGTRHYRNQRITRSRVFAIRNGQLGPL